MTTGPQSEARVSIVVCSLNGAATIQRCLDALAAQTIGPDCQVVLVDDGSVDDTAGIMRRWAEDAGRRLGQVEVIVHPANRGLSAARNTGASQATAPCVAFTDDDCVPHQDWAEELLALLARSGAVIVGGEVAPLATDSVVRRYLGANNPLAALELELAASTSLGARGLLYLRSNLTTTEHHDEREVYSVVGANFAVTRTALRDLGGFDDRITFAGDEEDLCRRAAAQGALVVVGPGPLVDHDFERGLVDTLRRSYAYGRGSARNWIRREDQGPGIFPLPLLLVPLSLAAVRRRSLRCVVAALPLAFYGRHLRQRQHWSAKLLHPYLQLLQEAAGDVGFLAGWRTYSKIFERSRRS